MSFEQLLDETVAQASLSVNETLAAHGQDLCVVIGSVQSQPVYYQNQAGVHFWGLQVDDKRTLNFWLTYPAQLPGW